MILGIVGFLGSGKGTVGDILAADYSFKKLAFADPLKDAVSSIFGWRRALLEGDTQESREFRETVDPFWSARLGKEITPRKALQLMGTEAGRNVFGEDIWVASLVSRAQVHHNVVVTDVRFRNEIAALREEGGKIVRVKRGPEPEYYDVALYNRGIMDITHPNIHPSEWDWIGSEFDMVIENEGTIDDLKVEVKNMLRILKNPATISFQL